MQNFKYEHFIYKNMISKSLIPILLLMIFLVGCSQTISQDSQNEKNNLYSNESEDFKTEDVIDNPIENKTEPEVFETIPPVEKIPESKTTKLDAIETNCVGFLIHGPGEEENIKLIGGTMGRPHPGQFSWGLIETSKDNYNFRYTDGLIRNAQKFDVAVLGTIWPYAKWDQAKCHDVECTVPPNALFALEEDKQGIIQGIPMSRCEPCNYDDYKEFLQTLVERYDGDGYKDMHGLKYPVIHWEILNEPEMQEGNLIFFLGTPEEYAQILKNSYTAIKEVCEDCIVVQGGAAGNMRETLEFWSDVFSEDVTNYFDVANVHFIEHGDKNTLNVEEFKELLDSHNIDKPIWVTEVQYSSEENIVSSVNGAFDAGASKLFFVQFEIGKWTRVIPGKYSKIYEDIPAMCR